MCFIPNRNDPKKTHQLIFATHPVPGQSRDVVCVYVFFLSLKKNVAIIREVWAPTHLLSEVADFRPPPNKEENS